MRHSLVHGFQLLEIVAGRNDRCEYSPPGQYVLRAMEATPYPRRVSIAQVTGSKYYRYLNGDVHFVDREGKSECLPFEKFLPLVCGVIQPGKVVDADGTLLRYAGEVFRMELTTHFDPMLLRARSFWQEQKKRVALVAPKLEMPPVPEPVLPAKSEEVDYW